jgi:hypothetical protein
MTKIHVISDLFLGFNEFSTEEEHIPDVDLVIVNGNIGLLKRSMLYTETLCKKYPDTQFIYNYGQTESAKGPPKYLKELDDGFTIRKNANDGWPKNLHWSKEPQLIKLRNGHELNILCTYGYPHIYECSIPWTDTVWHRDHMMNILDDVPLDKFSNGDWGRPRTSSPVNHGWHPIWATKEWINEQHKKEWDLVRNWEVYGKGYKILVTHFNPYKDSRYEGQKTGAYNIHLNQGLWIGADTECNGVKFVGGRLYSNPGRGPLARQKVITID